MTPTTEVHRLMFPETGKQNIKVHVNLVPSESSGPAFPLCPHTVERENAPMSPVEREGAALENSDTLTPPRNSLHF